MYRFYLFCLYLVGSSIAELIASQLDSLFSLDVDWTRENILPLLDWSTAARQALQAWNGFLSWGQWNEYLLPDLMPLYEQTFVHISDLSSSELRNRFSEHLASIAVYSLRNPVQEEWLGKFLKAVTPEERKRWASHITQILHSMQEGAIQDLWNRWLEDYWGQRIIGIPLPLEPDELKEMIEWSVYLKPVFPKVVKKICDRPVPSFNYERFYHKLAEKDFPNIYPEPLAQLILHLLPNTNPLYSFAPLEKLVKSLIDSNAPHYELHEICNQLARLGCQNAAGLEELLK